MRRESMEIDPDQFEEADFAEDGDGGLESEREQRLDHLFESLSGGGVLSLQNKRLCQRRFATCDDRNFQDLDEVLLTGERRRRKLQKVA